MSPPDALAELARGLPGYDADDLPVPVAQAFIARMLPPVRVVEHLSLRAALDRVLAHDIVAGLDVPAHDNAAMDGYALRGSELREGAASVLAVVATELAGDAAAPAAGPGECVRIMTGAVMPPGLDTVVPQELVQREGARIMIPAGAVRPGANRRLAGEDLALGSIALPAGRRLRPADLGLLASLGRAEVPVWRRPRVAFFSTGNELRPVGEPLDAGGVYDSNRYTLWGMLQRLGVEVLDLGIVRDEPASLEATLRHAAENADVVITSGGVSVGEADHTRAVMARLGEVLFWRIAMRPGRPMAVGRLHSAGREALLFGLPGNPVAVMVTFYTFVREALLAMSGATPVPLPRLVAACTTTIRKRPGRTEYQRGIVSRDAQGAWQVAITGSQGSGVLRSMSEANGLVVLAPEQGDVAAGSLVEVLPFDGLV